jgi:hypothetical protein
LQTNLEVAWDPSYDNLLELAEACDAPVGAIPRLSPRNHGDQAPNGHPAK